MSFLYPLFLAGIAAIGVPILLHMIRRHTRNRVAFSSLMFLRSTLPRFRNRSRIENWPLLLLRCLIVALLALAFARPFLPQPMEEQRGDAGRRLVVLVDTSASMRRAGMWPQAIEQVQEALSEADPDDRASVITFAGGPQTLMGFDEWQALDPSQRVSTAIAQLSQMSPSWEDTNLGSALIAGAEALEDDEVNAKEQAGGAREVVLVSDLQEGSDIEALRTYEWPEGLRLTIDPVASPGTTNAALQIVANRDPLAPAGVDDRPSIRIANSDNATAEQFQLRWASDTASDSAVTVDAYIPPGHSSVVTSPDDVEASLAHRLVLSGDDQDFDNTLYLAPHLKQQVNILYLGGTDPNNPKDMLYYVRQAFSATGATDFEISFRSGNTALTATDAENADIIVVGEAIGGSNVTTLRRYLEEGHPVLWAIKSIEDATGLAELAGLSALQYDEANVSRYALLSRLDYDHPLLAPFSDPRFGDFSRVHFWQYRRVDLDGVSEARVLASFDSGDPALFEIPVGSGTLLVLTCGWHPADSDLALSSKFVPLLYSILEYGGALRAQQHQYFVGDPVPLPADAIQAATGVSIRKPDQSVVSIEAGARIFDGADQPGIYCITSGAGETLFAVNIAPQESQTDPMPIEELENTGLAQSAATAAAAAGMTRSDTVQVNDYAKMEAQQKLWRWVLVLVLAALLLETWLAGWLTGRRPETQEQ